jgi:hypothetical protein
VRRAFVLALAAMAFGAAVLSATTVAYVPMRKSVEMSDLVLVGHVLGIEADYNLDGEIVTKVQLLVEETLKGGVKPGQVFTFHAWGGSLDGVHVETVGEARYRMGEKVLVQLESIDGDYHTLGLSFGKWSVVRDEDGSQWATRSLADRNVVGVTERPAVRLPLGSLKREILRAAGRGTAQ